MILRLIKWSLGIPIGIAAYLYDDALWGPIPIGIMNHLFGWPYGFALLCVAYFLLSFLASYLILRHYEQKKPKHTRKKGKLGDMNKKKGFAYKSLVAGKWLGLIVSCFILGAILTSIIVGRLRLFRGIDKAMLSFIMSSTFVVLFMGFYGGLYASVISYGLITALVGLLMMGLIVKLLVSNLQHT